MICFLTARRLRPGAWEEFRRAWEPGEGPPFPGRAYHVRSLRDENEVISFGLFDVTREELERFRADPGQVEEEERRAQRMAELIEQVLIDGTYEVIDEVEFRGRAS